MTLPITRTCPHLPHPEHVRLREEAPISQVTMPNGQKVWALTRAEDIRALLTDPRFSSDRSNPNFPTTATNRRAGGIFTRTMVTLDEPEHSAVRRTVISEFTVKRINALKPRIQQIVDERIDAMLAGEKPVDLVQALSLPVPSLVICELLGVPYRDHDFFQTITARLVNRNTPAEQRRADTETMQQYFEKLVTEKEQELPDDLLGRLARKQREEQVLDHKDMVSMAFLLLVAGHETTANMISLGTLGLLENPDQLALIKADPSKTPAAVEELLRYYTIVEFALSRVALEDAEIGGVKIKAGEGVVVLNQTANHDPGLFENPDELNIERGTRQHLTFGFGFHQCLGQNLARLELQIVFDTLFTRIPGLKLAAPADELPFKDDAAIYGLYKLPVTW